MIYYMKKVTVRDLRYRFRDVEDLLREGEEIQITKRKQVIARLVPTDPSAPTRRPDFLARLNKLYRGKRLKVSGAKLVAQERGCEQKGCLSRSKLVSGRTMHKRYE